jgi:hypothetical protein
MRTYTMHVSNLNCITCMAIRSIINIMDMPAVPCPTALSIIFNPRRKAYAEGLLQSFGDFCPSVRFSVCPSVATSLG